MKPDGVARRDKGKKIFYLHFAEPSMKAAVVNAPPIVATASLDSLIDRLINLGVPPEVDSFHLICREDGTEVRSHDLFIDEIAKDGETWEEPVNAGPEASTFMGEARGSFSVAQAVVLLTSAIIGDCSTCPGKTGYRCLKREAPFSRQAFDCKVAKLEGSYPSAAPKTEGPPLEPKVN